MTDINISDGALLEALNAKADVDLNNADPSLVFTSQSAGWGMPSDEYIDLTLGVSASTYTAPDNGWYYITKGASTNQFIVVTNTTANFKVGMASSNNNQCICFLPAKKGDVVQINYQASGTLEAFRFIYAKGEI